MKTEKKYRPNLKPPPGSIGRHRHTGSRSETCAVVLATVKNLVSAGEKDPKVRYTHCGNIFEMWQQTM
jgi:hypothetical protein